MYQCKHWKGGLECDSPTDYLHFPGFRSLFSRWRFRWSCPFHSPLFPGHLPHRSSTKPLHWMGLVCIDYKTKLLITGYLTLPGIYHLIIHSFKIRMQTAEFYQLYELNMLLVLNFQLKELFQFLHSKNLIMKLSKNCDFFTPFGFFNVYNIED